MESRDAYKYIGEGFFQGKTLVSNGQDIMIIHFKEDLLIHGVMMSIASEKRTPRMLRFD